jgi:hypothetical protein
MCRSNVICVGGRLESASLVLVLDLHIWWCKSTLRSLYVWEQISFVFVINLTVQSTIEHFPGILCHLNFPLVTPMSSFIHNGTARYFACQSTNLEQ